MENKKGVIKNANNKKEKSEFMENIISKALVLLIMIFLAGAQYVYFGGLSAFGYGGGGGGGGNIPTSPYILINNGDANTTSTNVTLTLSAAGAVNMAISNNSDFSGVSWEPYAATKTWTLLSGAGTKTVYAKFRGSSGSESSPVSDTIAFSAAPAIPATPATPGETPATPATPATPPSYKDGDLLKSLASNKVYVIKDGKKLWVKTLEEFKANGYKWGDVKNVSNETLGQISSYAVLIRAENDPKVYVIENGKKKHIPSAEAFNTGGYDWADVQVLDETKVDSYPDVIAVILMRAGNDPKVYVIENGKKKHIPSVEAFNSAGYDWLSIQVVDKSKLGSYAEEVSGLGAAVVNSTWLRIRSSNSTAGKMLGLTYKGEEFEILSENNGWYKINKSGVVGWISGQYATKK